MCTAPQQPRLMRNYACGIGFDDDIPVRPTAPEIVEIIVEEKPAPDTETNDIQRMHFNDVLFSDPEEDSSVDKELAVIRDNNVSPESGSSVRAIKNSTRTKTTNSRGRAGPRNMTCS